MATSCSTSDKQVVEKRTAADLSKVSTEDSNSRFEDIKIPKERNSLKMSDAVYKRLAEGWKDQHQNNPKLGTKILRSLPELYNFKVFTIEQFWDLCSTFEYAIVVDSDSNFVNAFPYSVIESGCEGEINISTKIRDDSIIDQVKK